jgi:uncharacterized membrane protein YczE
MPLDQTLLLATLALGGAVLLSAAVVREVARDGYGVRPAPRSHRTGSEPAGRPLALPGRRGILRGGRLLVGLGLYGAAIALMLRAHVGVGPWDVLSQGVAGVTGLPFGVVTNGIGALLLLAWWPLRQRPGVGTLANVLLVGSSAQVVLDLTRPVDGPVAQALLFAVGMLLLAVATAVYVGAGLGAGPRDGLMLGLHRRLGLPIQVARTLVEGTALLAGWLLGGNVGIGTVVFAVGIGPLCALAIRLLAPAELVRRP